MAADTCCNMQVHACVYMAARIFDLTDELKQEQQGPAIRGCDLCNCALHGRRRLPAHTLCRAAHGHAHA